MGDRVAVMRKGELQQVAPPQELYDRPVNLFVGGFIGSPGDEHARGDRQRGGTAGTRSTLGGSQKLAARRRGRGRDARRSRTYDGRTRDPRDPARVDSRRRALARDAPAGSRLRGDVELREALGSELDGALRRPGGPARRHGGDDGAGPRVERRGRDRDRGRAARRAASAPRARSPRARRSRSRSTRARCTSSTRRRDLASTSRRTTKGATT